MGRPRLNPTCWKNSSADQGAGISGCSARSVSVRSRRRLKRSFTSAPLLWKMFELPNLVDYALQVGETFRGETARPQRHALHSGIPDCSEQTQVSVNFRGGVGIKEVLHRHCEQICQGR